MNSMASQIAGDADPALSLQQLKQQLTQERFDLLQIKVNQEVYARKRLEEKSVEYDKQLEKFQKSTQSSLEQNEKKIETQGLEIQKQEI